MSGYFSRYCATPRESRGRRLGAAGLFLVSAATVVEAFFSQALFWGDGLAGGAWALMRLPLLAATLFISILILRRLRG